MTAYVILSTHKFQLHRMNPLSHQTYGHLLTIRNRSVAIKRWITSEQGPWRGRGRGGFSPPPPPHFFRNFKELLRNRIFQPPHFQSSSAGPAEAWNYISCIIYIFSCCRLWLRCSYLAYSYNWILRYFYWIFCAKHGSCAWKYLSSNWRNFIATFVLTLCEYGGLNQIIFLGRFLASPCIVAGLLYSMFSCKPFAWRAWLSTVDAMWNSIFVTR